MFFDELATFVDRKQELAHFHRMLARELDEQVMLLLQDGEQGKSWFLKRLLRECEEHPTGVPVVFLDFAPNSGLLRDYAGVASEIRRCLGNARTPVLSALQGELYGPGPVVNVQSGQGDVGGLDLGRRNRFSDAQLADLAGRDNIQLSHVSVTQGAPSPRQQAWQRDETGRALGQDLAAFAGRDEYVVLLLDAFEHASEELCAWLDLWLFDRLRHELSHVLLVVAGRPKKCEAFFARSRLRRTLITAIDFEPLGGEDVRAYCRLRNLTVPPERESDLLVLAGKSPAKMSQYADLLVVLREAGQ